ncbi:tetratricopeptide repeat protein [Chloroflexota bacterium]
MRRLSSALLLSCLLLTLIAGPVHAQEPTTDPRQPLPPTWTYTPTFVATATPRPIPTRVPTITPSPVPSPWPTYPPAPRAVRLDGMTLVWQEYNGCAAAALTMLLFYHGWDGTRDQVSRGIKPQSGDVSVRGIEMVRFVEAQGLKAVERTGGNLDVIRHLLAAGFPVLVENAYNPGGSDWMGHNRVIMGYDDAAAVVYTFDSVLGNGPDDTGRAISFIDFYDLWQPFNHTYLVVYPPQYEPTIRQILGPQWNATANAAQALARAEQEIERNPDNAYAMFNLGTALLTLGRAEEAITAFERALDLGLPWRYLWYQFGPLQAYLQAERYENVIGLAEEILNTTRSVEEVYFYMGQAYTALGDSQRAATSFQRALAANPNYTEASLALERATANGDE